jgi:hypothetical protein
MKAIRLGVFAVVVPALTSPVVHARVSGDPFGAYCIVQKVVPGQDEGQRSTIQIWGTCSVRTVGAIDSQGNSVDASTPGAWLVSPLAPPHRGYLYYFTTKPKEDVAQKEWADLKALAGTGEVVAIGSQQSPSRLRWADEKPQSPDEYPTQMGLWKITMNQAYSKIVADLKKVADGK